MKTRRQRWLSYGGSLCLYGCGPSADHSHISSFALWTSGGQETRAAVWRDAHLEVGGVDLLQLLLLLGVCFSSEHQLVGRRTENHNHCGASEQTCHLPTLSSMHQTGEQCSTVTFTFMMTTQTIETITSRKLCCWRHLMVRQRGTALFSVC